MDFNIKNARTRQEALSLLCSWWTTERQTELVPLAQALGRVSSEDIYAVNNLPVHRVSSFDGFAVRSADFENGLPDTSNWTQGEEYTPADTGDDFPDEYDTVIAVEDVHFDSDGRLHLNADFEFVKGDAVRPAGSTVRQGELLVRAHASDA